MSDLTHPQIKLMRRFAPGNPVYIVTFHNWSDRPFTWAWDGVPYHFEPNEKVKMENYKAELFAIHLAEREAEKEKVVPVRATDPFIRLVNRAIIGTKGKSASTSGEISRMKTDLLNAISGGEDVHNVLATAEREAKVSYEPTASFDPEVDDEVMPEAPKMENLAEELVKENEGKLKKKPGRPKKEAGAFPDLKE